MKSPFLLGIVATGMTACLALMPALTLPTGLSAQSSVISNCFLRSAVPAHCSLNSVNCFEGHALALETRASAMKGSTRRERVWWRSDVHRQGRESGHTRGRSRPGTDLPDRDAAAKRETRQGQHRR